MTVLVGAAFAVAPSMPLVAAADGGAYCRKVQARASSDADVLMSPRIFLQGIRFPSGGPIDSGATTGTGFQVRAGLSFSPLDYDRAISVLHMADADCERHRATEDLEDALVHGSERARRAALNAQAAFLRAHRDDWRALADKAAARLSERIITLVEYGNMRSLVDGLEHKLVQVEGEAKQIDPRGPRDGGDSSAPLGDLATRYDRQTMRFERAASHLRGLDAWKLQLTGGVVPQAPVDWYGVAEVSFSLGGLVRDRQEERYLEARSEELRDARDELRSQLDELRSKTDAALEQARRDLGVVEHSIEVISTTRTALQGADNESVAQARDTLSVEELSVESDRVFLRALTDALAALAERARG